MASLSAQEMSGAQKTIAPLSTDIFQALDKLHEHTDWAALLAATEAGGTRDKTSYASNQLKALNLGVRVADAFIAIEAKDAKALQALSKTLIALAQPLGVSKEITDASDGIQRNAQANKWNEVRQNVIDLQDKIRAELEDQKRGDEAVLVVVGGWLQGLHLVTKSLSTDYDAKATSVLRQQALVDSLTTQLNGLSADAKKLPSVQQMTKDLPEIGKLVNVGKEEPVSKEKVKSLYEISSKIAQGITAG